MTFSHMIVYRVIFTTDLHLPPQILSILQEGYQLEAIGVRAARGAAIKTPPNRRLAHETQIERPYARAKVHFSESHVLDIKMMP